MQRRLLILSTMVAAGILLAGCGGAAAPTDTAAAGAAGAPADTGAATPVANTGAAPTDEVGDALNSDVSGNTIADPSGDIPESVGHELDDPFSASAAGMFNHAEKDEGDTGVLDTGLDTTGGDNSITGTSITTGTTTTSTSTTKAVSMAKIQVEVVGVGAASVFNLSVNSLFPKDTQQFVVKSITTSSAVVELTAGEFSNGSTGWTLVKGKPVTLVNQNEGTTYKLLLLSTS